MYFIITCKNSESNLRHVMDPIQPASKPKGSMEEDVGNSEGRESRSRLGLETKATKTLGLVSVSY